MKVTTQLEYFDNNEGAFRQQNSSLVFELRGEKIQIEPWGKNSFRVRVARDGRIRDDLPGALLSLDEMGFKGDDIKVNIEQEEASIQNGNIQAKVSKRGGKIVFYDQIGQELLSEGKPHIWVHGRQFHAVGGDLYKIEANFKAYDDEKLYGLGQHANGRLDQKGCVIDLAQRNSDVTIPFMVSSRRYGFLWNNPGLGRVELGHNMTRWVADASYQLEYWITAGDTVADIMSNYVDATGHSPLLPYYASGFWQCRLRYRTQEEVLTVARKYKELQLPLDIIVIDFFHWNRHGDWKFDPLAFPDPAAMVKELKEMNVEVMVSIWPTLTPDSENFEPMERQGLLLRNTMGPAIHHRFYDNPSLTEAKYITHYDATNPKAREYLWNTIKKNYYDIGIKLFWLDADEPEVEPVEPQMLRFHIGEGRTCYNYSVYLHGKGLYDGLASEGHKNKGGPGKGDDIITLSRSGWAGCQRWGQAIWSGDIDSTFESLRQQVRVGMNMALSGIPWWTTDIGGFVHGNIHDPEFRELIVRWFQYGTFCPLFRLHGFREPLQDAWYGAENEVWSFGDEAYNIISKLLHLRERLRPYVMEQMKLASENGTPSMRPLFFDFEADTAAWNVEDQFMFGPDLLVAPVTEYKSRARSVYLPSGAKWTDAWTGEIYEGGQTLDVDVPLSKVPLYLKDDAQLPIQSA